MTITGLSKLKKIASIWQIIKYGARRVGVLGKHIRDYLDTQCNFCILSSFPPPDGLAAFRAFLKSEFCEENIEFWLACEDFKKTKSPQKLSSKAKKIYTDFIEKEAPKEVMGGKSSLFQHIFNILSTKGKRI